MTTGSGYTEDDVKALTIKVYGAAIALGSVTVEDARGKVIKLLDWLAAAGRLLPEGAEITADPPPVLEVHKAALQEIDGIVGNESTLNENETARLRGILFAALSEEHDRG